MRAEEPSKVARGDAARSPATAQQAEADGNPRVQRAEAVSATGFVLRAIVWIAALFGLLRLGWVQANLLIPFAAIQERVAAAVAGKAQTGVVVDQSCTGSDALALAIGAILAFPAPWRRRLAGAAIGFALITVVNTLRIGSLAAVVSDRRLFELLHVRLWPAVLVLVAAGYVFLWMRSAASSTLAAPGPRGPRGHGPAGSEAAPPAAGRARLWRFLAAAGLLLAAYFALAPRLEQSAAVNAIAGWAAAVAGTLMSAAGVSAAVEGGLLRTAHGAWLVTPACVLTPLIPIYLAAALTAPLGARWRAPAVLLAPLLFFCLGTARLLVLALPAVVVGSHMVAIHAFYQLLAATLAVCLVARARSERPLAAALAHRAVPALGWGIVAALVAGAATAVLWRPLAALPALHLGHGWTDGQGALAIAPAYAIGLWFALGRAAGAGWKSRRLLGGGLAVAAVIAVSAVLLGEAATHAAIVPPVVLVRAWSLAVPLAGAAGLGWLRGAPAVPAAGRSRTAVAAG